VQGEFSALFVYRQGEVLVIAPCGALAIEERARTAGDSSTVRQVEPMRPERPR